VRGIFRVNRPVVPQTVSFQGEVSPYPSSVRKGKPLRFFYAGPEIGRDVPQLNLRQHFPLLIHMVVEERES
jgi:hypothetical protein